MQVEERNPADLKIHALNSKLYGEKIDIAFMESIAANGIATPITVCKSKDPAIDGFIVKGRRRVMAALNAKLDTVACYIWKCDDQLEFERQLILDNVNNDRTTEQLVRMYTELRRITDATAARVASTAATKNLKSLPSNLTGGENPIKTRRNKGRDDAAASVGMKPTQAFKAAKVVEAADKLEAEGKTEQAAEVIETLNTKSVAAAERKVAEVAPAVEPTADEYSKAIDKLVVKLNANLSVATKIIADLFNAIDRKVAASPGMESQKKRYESLMRRMGELMDQASNHSGVITKAWQTTKKAVDV